MGNTKHTINCYHCGDVCNEQIVFQEKAFCCNGCKTVFEILNDNGLTNYYKIEDKPGVKNEKISSYDFLDSEKVVNSLLLYKDENTANVEVLLPQIHCASCIWLLENLHVLHKGVKSVEVNFVQKKARISYNPQLISLKKLAILLGNIGYPPMFDIETKKENKHIHKGFYIRLGIAGFCFGNIMLLSFPEYLGLSNENFKAFGSLFRYLILALSLPILIIAYKEYINSAIKGLKQKFIGIDVPISIGILVLFSKSVYDVVFLEEATYLDSFSGFVFFLLIGKWFQNKTYQTLSFERDYKSYFPLAIGKKNNQGDIVMTPIEELQENDVMVIKHNDIIPADGVLLTNSTHVNYAFVTGESELKKVDKGALIYAGGRLSGNEVELQVKKKANRSYLTHLWNQTTFTKPTHSEYSKITNNLSKVFTIVLLFISMITGTVWYFIEASQVTFIVVSVLIVACPCALALALPFTYGNALRFMGKNGLYLKNAYITEKLSEVTDLVFDKTGTLTHVNKSQVKWLGEPLSERDKICVYSLASQSKHILSQAISNFLNQSLKEEVLEYNELVGKGLEAQVLGNKWKLGSAEFIHVKEPKTGATVYVKKNNKVLGKFVVSNKYRKEVSEIAAKIKEQGLHIHVLSGDNEAEKENIKTILGSRTQTKFNQKPIDKLNYIKQLQAKGKKVLMLGDGLNDSGALKQSDVGIALVDDIYQFSPSSDGILRASFFKNLPCFLVKAKVSITILKVCFVFSFLYNVVGLYFAVTGQLTPLVATILMPLSSISVVVISSVLSKVYFSKSV